MFYDMDGRQLPGMVIIPARKGSKGIPNKAFVDLDGKPLIAHTIEYARTIKGIDRILVSTDSPQIQRVAVEYGAEAPFLRPEDLADHFSTLDKVFQHALGWYKEHENFVPRVLVTLYSTNPFRRPGLVDIAIRWGLESPLMLTVASMAPVDVPADSLFYHDEPERPLFERFQEGCATPILANSGSFNVQFPGRDLCLDDGRLAPFVINAGIALTPVEAIDMDEPEDLELARSVVEQGMHVLPALQWDRESLEQVAFFPPDMAPDAYDAPHAPSPK